MFIPPPLAVTLTFPGWVLPLEPLEGPLAALVPLEPWDAPDPEPDTPPPPDAASPSAGTASAATTAQSTTT
jgi:hypothetical protein